MTFTNLEPHYNDMVSVVSVLFTSLTLLVVVCI
jgi:hypothetical protein